MRSTSSCSSASSSRMRLPNSIAAGGSTNIVPPVPDVPCTIPPTCRDAFAPHRDHVASLAHRHRHVGRAVMRLERAHHPLEDAHELSVRRAQLATDAPQRRRRIVAHDAVLTDRALDRSSSLLATTIRSANGASTARSTAGPAIVAQRVARSARGAQQHGAGDSSCATSTRYPTTRSRCSASSSSGTGSGCQGGSPPSSPRTAADAAVLRLEPLRDLHGARARARGRRRARTRRNRPRAPAVAAARECPSACAFITTVASRDEKPERDAASVRVQTIQRSTHRHPCLLNSSRAIALIVLPSARPLNCGSTFPITAPICAAPPAIAARTAARNSSSLTDAGRYVSRMRDFSSLLLGKILALAGVHLDRLAAPLDALPEHVDHFVVREIASELDLPVLGVGEDRAKHEDPSLVLGLAGGVQIGLERVEQGHCRVRGGRRKLPSRARGRQAVGIGTTSDATMIDGSPACNGHRHGRRASRRRKMGVDVTRHVRPGAVTREQSLNDL